MIVLVTGATGFIGTHLVKDLVEAGHRVVGVDINPPHPAGEMFLQPVASRVQFVQADVSSPGAVHRVVRTPVDAVIHAISSGLGNPPERIATVIVVSALEMLRFAQQAGARRFVFVSSSGVYGQTDPGIPIAETHPAQLTSVYPIAKFSSERIVQWFAAHEGMTAVSARIAAPYGPMERPTPTRKTMSPIHRLVHAALEGRTIEIPGPQRKRDWTHAADIAQGLRLLVEQPDPPESCYNVSCGSTASLATVAEILARLAPEFSWVAAEGEGNVGDAPVEHRGPMDIGRLRALGFAPKYGVEEGLQDTMVWVRRFRAAGIHLGDG
jgi:UDP-glucose 4-epimerase